MQDIERLPGPGSATYSDAVVTSGSARVAYVSGQLPVGEDGQVVSGGMEEQSRACFANVDRVLGRAGATLTNVVRITVFVTSLDDYADFARVRGETFAADDFPASTAVCVSSLLGGALIEIDAIAHL